ncbi:MAG: hypothetical protein IJW99_11390 [Clostridia bacterium]|nr:hypothetical protein [Clostridia bacterium]
MRLPLSPKTIFRLHRKLFMLRTPSYRNCALILDVDRDVPTLRLQWERERMPVWTVAVSALALLFSAVRLIVAVKGRK